MAFDGDLGGARPMAPIAAKGSNATIFDSTAVTGAQTPLTANYKAGTVLDLGVAGNVALTLKYDAHASATANQLKFLVFVSNHATEPLVTDDVWGAITERDIAATNAVLTDSMPTNVDMTVAPAWANIAIRPLSFELAAMTANTHKQRPTMVIIVRSWKWLCVLAKEEGDTTNVGTFVCLAALSA